MVVVFELRIDVAVSDENVRPTVVVIIEKASATAQVFQVAAKFGVERPAAERPVALVAVEIGKRRRQSARPAEHRHTPREAVRPRAGELSGGGVEVDIARHEQVELAIAIVVYKRTAGTPVA